MAKNKAQQYYVHEHEHPTKQSKNDGPLNDFFANKFVKGVKDRRDNSHYTKGSIYTED